MASAVLTSVCHCFLSSIPVGLSLLAWPGFGILIVVAHGTTGIMMIVVTFLMMYRIRYARRARTRLFPTPGNHGAAVISINRRTISIATGRYTHHAGIEIFPPNNVDHILETARSCVSQPWQLCGHSYLYVIETYGF